MINPELNVGDNIVLLHMEDESMSPGTKGVVRSITEDPFERNGGKIINVLWENGSSLSLLSNLDAWMIDKKKINESESHDKFFMSNLDIVRYFNTRFFTEYLTHVRDSGIVNMFGASPYLYLGTERIEHEFHYKEFVDEESEESFRKVLEMANESQSNMINGTIELLKKQNKELTLDNINYHLKKNASRILSWYMHVLS